MADPVNLNHARKTKARVVAEAQAVANRQKFGRTRAEKLNDKAAVLRLDKKLDQTRREDDSK